MPSRYHFLSHDERSRTIHLPRLITHLTMPLQKPLTDYAAAAIYSWQPATTRTMIRATNVQLDAIPETLACRFGMNG